MAVHWTKWFQRWNTTTILNNTTSHCPQKTTSTYLLPLTSENPVFLDTNELKIRFFFAKRSQQHHAWFTTNECFTSHCPVAASRMLGHWRCRETPRGKWWSRTSGCEPQGSLGAETCLLRGRNIGTASRVAEFLLEQQNNSKQTCSYELFNGPGISLWKPNAPHSVHQNLPTNHKPFNLFHNLFVQY